MNPSIVVRTTFLQLLSSVLFLAMNDTLSATEAGKLVLRNVTEREGGYELSSGPNVEGVVFLRQVYPKEESWPEPVIEAFHRIDWVDAASVRLRWADFEPRDQEFRWQASDRILAEVRKYNQAQPTPTRPAPCTSAPWAASTFPTGSPTQA